MRQQYYDLMAIVRQFGKPDLFITVTTNPKWPEIQDSFLPGQTASDRPDIVARVFKMKLKALLENIVKNRVFGGLQAYVYVIEFQKRGLPQAHILVILSGDSKPRSSADYDRFVCAEIPDHETNPELFETVSTCMIYGPCGAGINSPCVGEDGKCSKRLPKDFVDDTRVDGAGYPVYRRRRSGPIDPALPMGPQRPSSLRTIFTTIRDPRQNGHKSRRETVVVDNRWVVPYNPYICQKYNCRVNVEICSTMQSVKYLYKYVYKGQDRATVALRGRREWGRHTAGNTNVNNEEEVVDEIQQYLDARYLPPPEACWTIFKYDMQKKSHHVHRLPVHVEGGQMAHYSTAATLQDVLELNQFTMLTAFFELCGLETPEGLVARGLLYHEMPIHFVWKKVVTRNTWMSRKQGGDKAIGRMISVSPRDTIRFYIRLLLCYRRGPISYDDLKTVEGETHATFKGAALAMGFLDSDEDNHRCLTEAAHFKCLRNCVTSLCEDFLRDEIEIHNLQARAENCISEVIIDAASLDTNSRVYRRAIYLTLHDVNSHLVSFGQTLHTYFESLPQFSDYSDAETAADVNDRNRNRLIENETSYESTTVDYQAAALNSLNADQKRVYDKVMEAVHPAGSDASVPVLSGKQFSLDGPGGTAQAVQGFADYLLRVGDGRHETCTDLDQTT
ncbi:hypothetical protein PC128_g19681 [Phytophthora cactorum]|nr:hypothetical protein PC128_g19681 [Phytophthora cactorum]